MGNTSTYWQLVTISSSGHPCVSEILAAKEFFQQMFPEFTKLSNVSNDTTVHRLLWQKMQQNVADGNEEAYLAEICLRCYISSQIYQVCLNLVVRFGSHLSFSIEDLLPFVLDDQLILNTPDQPIVRKSAYESLATKLLKTFDPAKGTLITWINRYVKQHPELKRFLLQYGVLFISDWALLNDTDPKKLQRILAGMYNLTVGEIEQVCQLLVSYNAVCRKDRLQKRLAGVNLTYHTPTEEQLTHIANDLQRRTNRRLSQVAVLTQLQGIAQKLRQYRIVSQGGNISSVAYDQPEIQPLLERSQITQDDDEEKFEFINLYRQLFLECLDIAISQVVESFLEQMQGKRDTNKNKAQLFLTGLHLFHCQGKPMSKIALELGMKKQYEVTRLLKLNNLRADIGQKMLIILRTRVLEIAQQFTDSQHLQPIKHQLESILDEQIFGIIQEAESETRNPVRNQPLSGLFARRLCRYLDERIREEGSDAVLPFKKHILSQ